jgi:nonsense-mediated mRNA decay protein 3
MCVDCLKGEVDITQQIQRSAVATFCRECVRWQRSDGSWQKAELESRELLAVCLKRVKGLDQSGCKLTDAGFIWTEPNCKRLKVKLTVQKELSEAGLSGGGGAGNVGAIMQQELTIEYFVTYVQCDDCKRTYTPHVWNSIVQLRQKCEHKRTFFFLEQLILKHNMHERVVSIKNRTDGLDFHFGHRMHAQRFADFVGEMFPCKTVLSKHLVSHDSNNNSYNYKYAFQTDIAPVNRDDLVFVPAMSTGLRAKTLAGVGSSLLLCTKVSTNIHLFDVKSGKSVVLAGVEFWKHPFATVCGRKHLSEFVVLGGDEDTNEAFVELVRSDAMGEPNASVFVRRAAIPIVNLKCGDLVLGYDMRTVNLAGASDEELQGKGGLKDVDVVVVRKTVGKRDGERAWVLKALVKIGGDDRLDEDKGVIKDDEAEVEAFRRELEDDEEMRRDVVMFRRPGFAGRMEEEDGVDELEQMLQELKLNENETTL